MYMFVHIFNYFSIYWSDTSLTLLLWLLIEINSHAISMMIKKDTNQDFYANMIFVVLTMICFSE